MSIARPKNPRDRPSAEMPTRLLPVQGGSLTSEGGSSHARNIRDSDLQDIPVPLGEVIDSKYRVDRLIGAGGMGIVMAAHDVMLDRPVAVKFLHGLNSSTQEANSRFKREARAMAKLHSEHVVHVLDVGTLPSGEPYMVMEYLEGIDLAQLVKQRGFLPVPDAVDYILSASEAVAEAHMQGIIHRDLKPSNLYLAKRRDGTSTLKLLDFGIAKIATDTSEYAQSFTTTTALLGSPVYMSPEQLQCSRDADVRADIWSLGAIVYRLVSGRPPFAATTMPQLCTLIMTTSPQSLTELVADVPPGLSAVVMRCLEKNADGRYENVAELARALGPFGSGRAQVSVERALEIVYSSSGPPPPDPASSAVLLQSSRSSGPSLSARDLVGLGSRDGSLSDSAGARPSSKTLLLALLASLALGFGLGLLMWLRGRPVTTADEGSFSATTAEVATQTASAATAPTATPPPVAKNTQPLPETLPAPPPVNPGLTIPVSALPAAPVAAPPHGSPRPKTSPRPHAEPPTAPASPPPQAQAPSPPPQPPVPPANATDNSEFGNGRK